MKVCIEVHGNNPSAPRGFADIEVAYGVKCGRSSKSYGFEYEADFHDDMYKEAFNFGFDVYNLHNRRIKKISFSAGGGH